MAENFIFNYLNKQKKIEDSILDYDELQEKFISAYGLKEELKSQIKFFVNDKEITKEDELMNIISQDDVIEVKNINGDEAEIIKEETNEKNIEEEADKKETILINNLKEEILKNIEDILKEKFEENNQIIEKNISEKNDEKIESLKNEILDSMEEKINKYFLENEINKKISEIEDKIAQLNQDYIDFKSIKIKYFNKFIEFLDNKSLSQDSKKSEEPKDSIQNNDEIEKLKENNNKLKELIKKLKKEKDNLKEQVEKASTKKDKFINDSKTIEDLKKQNENLLLQNQKLNEEKNSLNNKIKNLENELKKNSQKSESKTFVKQSTSSKIKKYNCELNPDNKIITYQYEKVKENNLIEFNLIIKNIGEDELPKNSEIQLVNGPKGLILEQYKTKNAIKVSETAKLKLKIDLDSIDLNKDIGIKLKMIDDKRKIIEGSNCEINIKVEKEEIQEPEESNNNNNVLEEDDYKELYEYIDGILSIEVAGEDMTSFKEKLLNLLETKKDKYDGLTVKTEYLENLKADLEEVFQE